MQKVKQKKERIEGGELGAHLLHHFEEQMKACHLITALETTQCHSVLLCGEEEKLFLLLFPLSFVISHVIGLFLGV